MLSDRWSALKLTYLCRSAIAGSCTAPKQIDIEMGRLVVNQDPEMFAISNHPSQSGIDQASTKLQLHL
jgi:hypothetical protein